MLAQYARRRYTLDAEVDNQIGSSREAARQITTAGLRASSTPPPHLLFCGVVDEDVVDPGEKNNAADASCENKGAPHGAEIQFDRKTAKLSGAPAACDFRHGAVGTD